LIGERNQLDENIAVRVAFIGNVGDVKKPAPIGLLLAQDISDQEAAGVGSRI
jgi:hypothetical protein